MLGLEQYAKIKDNYCLGYFGNCDEYLVQLRLLKPTLERKFKGLNVYLSCKDESVHHLVDCKTIVRLSELRQRRAEFGHVKEIRFNGKEHPLSLLMTESEITQYAVPVCKPQDVLAYCVIVTKGTYPTVNLTKSQINTLSRIGRDRGYEVEIDTDWSAAGLVMGVESVGLFEAAGHGIETILVPTGVGERLYENMFPNGEILKV